MSKNNQAFPEGHARGLSKSEYAAIHLRVPESGTEWLDEMIRKSLPVTPAIAIDWGAIEKKYVVELKKIIFAGKHPDNFSLLKNLVEAQLNGK